MKQTLYIDVLFFINFIVDWFILMISADILRVKPVWWRTVAGAVLGGLFACLYFFLPSFFFLLDALLQILLLLFISYIVYGFSGIKEFLKAFTVIFFVTIVFGGTMLLLQYHTAAGTVMVFSKGALYFDMPFLWFIFFSAAAWLLVKGITGVLSWFRKKDVIFPVRITLNGKTIDTNGFYDTGNQLFDPITNLPVIIAEYSVIRSLLPQDVQICFREGMGCAVLADILSKSSFARKFRVIACKGAMGYGEILPGFLPDSLEISTKKGQKHQTYAAVGVTSQALSKTGGYHILLHPALM